MRIHNLHIEAIGPFPGRHDVNFEELSAGGLFLLEGPTGAGKSTLIDAITYGLYGTLGKALDSRLPSAHAPLIDPVIEVVFSTNAGIYRTRRTPPWDRPKKRGEGFTSQNATAKLWRLSSVDDSVGEAVAGSAQEVGAEMQQILGLTRDQFMQTVVLPQGRFSTFLRAKPDERAAVLRDVFGTAIYQQVQDQLAEMSRDAKRSITAVQGEMSSAVRTFTSLLSDGDPAAPELHQAGAELDTIQMLRISDLVLKSQQEHCVEAEEATQAARTREATARTFLESQKDLQRTLERRASLIAENSALLEQVDDVARDRDRVAAAQRAATVAGVLRAHDAATIVLSRSQTSLSQALSDVSGTADQDLAEVTTLPALREIIDDVAGERGGLAELVRLEAALPERVQRLTRDERELLEAGTALQVERSRLVKRPEMRNQLTTARDDLRLSATPVAAARLAADQRRMIRDAACRADRLVTHLDEAAVALKGAMGDAREATEAENAIRLRWINSTAGILAGDLTDGVPCPVCGGIEHPAPAPELPEHASLADVDAATVRCQQAVATLQEADRKYIRLTGEVAAQREAAHETSAGDAEAALVAAEAAVVEAEAAVVELEKQGEVIAEFDAGSDILRLRIAEAEKEMATTAERLRGDRRQLQFDGERCRLGADECEDVAARSQCLGVRLHHARRLADRRQEHLDAVHRLSDATVALDDALREAAFADARSVRAAELTAVVAEGLQQMIRQHDAALARVAVGLAEESVTALTGDEVVDVPAAKLAHDACHAELMAATTAEATAIAALGQLERSGKTLTKVLDRHGRVVDEAAPVLRMADLANAGEGNARSTTLSTFVLLRRFEDVVAAANDRLTVFSDGRFSLLRIDEREGRARRAGLGLSVRDHHTETNRDPHTLSGGETFYVSLCLALGLADVVTSEAGGISLDTLFIDEGFGSLDSETLDGVLGELAHLQAGGRAVGIVSHVAELKARIPERVEITRRASGGSSLVVRA
ncbi:MAG: AAA family ATPase [Arachnia sp.]